MEYSDGNYVPDNVISIGLLKCWSCGGDHWEIRAVDADLTPQGRPWEPRPPTSTRPDPRLLTSSLLLLTARLRIRIRATNTENASIELGVKLFTHDTKIVLKFSESENYGRPISKFESPTTILDQILLRAHQTQNLTYLKARNRIRRKRYNMYRSLEIVVNYNENVCRRREHSYIDEKSW